MKEDDVIIEDQATTVPNQEEENRVIDDSKIFVEVLLGGTRQIILDYKEKHKWKKLSTQKIADKAGSSYTTINGILNGSIEGIKLETVLEISRRLDGPSKIKELLEKVKKSEVQSVRKSYYYLMGESEHIMSPKIERFLSDPTCAKIIWAAYSRKNTTRDEIASRMGDEGVESLDLLLKEEVVHEVEGKIIGLSEGIFGGFQAALGQLNALSKICRPKKKYNLVCSASRSVTKDCAKKFYNKLEALFNEFVKESDLPENRGDHHVALGVVMSRFFENLPEVQTNDNNLIQ